MVINNIKNKWPKNEKWDHEYMDELLKDLYKVISQYRKLEKWLDHLEEQSLITSWREAIGLEKRK